MTKDRMNTNKISIIIPVYNVKKYLSKCIDSVINQSYENLQIILVDDGSTDGSEQICDDYKKKDKRVEVIHQTNRGLSAARNVGLDMATGNWVAFLDSDDWIDADMYETLLSVALEKKAEIVSCLSEDFIEEQLITASERKNFEVVEFGYNEIIRELVTQKAIKFEVWNKLWKRTLIGDTRFVEGQISEDIYFDRLLFNKAQKIYHINWVMHHYLTQRDGNTCSTFKPGRMCVYNEFSQWIQQLQYDYGNELAGWMALIAANFALNMYEQAVDTNQENSIKTQLIDKFKSYYKIMDSKHLKGRKAVKLFAISPRLFIFISRLRKGIYNE